MNSWIKHACWAVVPFVYIACNASQKIGRNYKNEGNHLKIDSLPVTIIEPVIAAPDSIAFADTSSNILLNRQYIFSIYNRSGVSETSKKKSENGLLLKNKSLSHMDFPDLKLAIDANGNISYLMQDF